MERVTVTAILKPKMGNEDELMSELKKVQRKSRQEPGCIKYDLYHSAEGPAFILFEIWENNAAIEQHINSSHYQEYREHTAALVSSREVYKMKTIE